jgi:hypothetical protein
MPTVSSLILSVASMLSLPCESVFIDAAARFHRSRKMTLPSTEERQMLWDFSAAACKTSNPDILWKIAATESGLRPLILLNNADHAVYRGAAVHAVIARSRGRHAQDNVDVGVLQINLKSHGPRMERLGLDPLNPDAQVRYVVDAMMPELTARCAPREWVGCYHSWSSPRRAGAYQARVKSHETVLRAFLADLYASRSKTATPLPRRGGS